MPHRQRVSTFLLLAATALFVAKGADAAETSTPALVGAAPEAPAAAPAQADDQSEQPNGFVRPAPASTLEWHGSLEADVGYAAYRFENDAARPQSFNDMRGRFVFGPSVEYRFKQAGVKTDWFLAARGEVVAWLRETNAYQINADDVYGQFGLKGVWDVKIGRFRTWRVYHKGSGFDLYTLEDVGACITQIALTGSCSLESGTGSFGPHTYEVSHIYDREPAGRLAFHAYPAPWLGLEMAGAVGNNGVANVLGARGAALVHFSFLRVSGAGEYRHTKPGQEQASVDPMSGAAVVCENCGVGKSYGYGGGLEVTLRPVMLGLNAAQSHETKYSATNGTLNRDESNQRTSLGGYAEVDVGSLVIGRGLTLGFGLNRTEVVDEVDNFEQHYQGAAYAVFPLGFNAASLKLVLSQATLDIESANGDGTASALPTSTMRAARIRLAYPF